MDSTLKAILVGLGLIAAGIAWLRLSQRKKARCTVPVAGTIVKVKRRYSKDSDGHGEYDYTPVYSYTVAGREYSAEADFSSNRKRAFKVGEVDELMVNPNKPLEFIAAGRSSGSALGIGLVAAGLLVIVAYVFLDVSGGS